MKRNLRFTFLLMALLPLIAIAQEYESGINSKIITAPEYEWVLNPKYENATSFTEANLAAAQMYGKWGYIDKTGKWKIQPQYGKAEPFCMGLAAVQHEEKWGFINTNGDWIIGPQFKYVTNYSEGLAGVCNGNWGFIDKTGNYAFETRFEDAGRFCEGLAGACRKGYWGFIDKTGAWVIKPQFEDVCVFSNGLAGASQFERWGFINKSGEWVIKPKYEDVGEFNEGLVAVKLNGKWGYVDGTGKSVIRPNYKAVTKFSNGLAAVSQKGKWGYIDLAGAWVIQPQFEDALCFAENTRIADVKQGEKWGYIERPSISSYIKKVVEKNVNEWQKKGEFEKTSEYQKRVNEQTRNVKIQQFTEEAIKQQKAEYAQKIQWRELQLSEYDADNETYLIKSAKLGNFAVPVSIADAPSFKQNWANLKFSNTDFIVNEEQFHLAKVTITNPTNAKSYIYDSKQATAYAANNITYNFAPVEVDITQNETSQNNTKIAQNNVVIGLSDVDINIPVQKTNNPHAYALIIGNEDYSSFQPDLSSEANVVFAVNDATIFRKYITGTLGIQENNMKFLSNATSGQMNQAISWINKLIQKEGGEAEVVVYYAGHGLPDEQTHEPYIIPVDVSGTNLQSAIKLQTLYTKLTEYPSKKITVFMDACFSGGSRGQGLLASRGVKVKPRNDMLTGNIVVITSSSGEQSSLPFKDKQHGIFTYYLLKKIQETKGDISYFDLYNYVKKEVDLNSVKINSKEQTPGISYSSELGKNWQEWKLK